jgi:integrase
LSRFQVAETGEMPSASVPRHVRGVATTEGRSLDSVSKLLGHSSIKITERHYAPWVKARQEQLESEVPRIWT